VLIISGDFHSETDLANKVLYYSCCLVPVNSEASIFAGKLVRLSKTQELKVLRIPEQP
jgi:hypothetical protein